MAYNRLGKQTKQVLENPQFIETITVTRAKWRLEPAWQKAILEDYIERIDHDLRIKANEENCFEIEEKLSLSPETRFHHGLDRALVDLYIRLDLFKENEAEKAISAVDPRRNWGTFIANIREICADFGLVSADALFVYRALLSLPPIDIVQVATTPLIEFSFDKNTGVNVIRIEMTDDALRYFSEYSMQMIKDAIDEIRKKKQDAVSQSLSGNLDATWYYKSYPDAGIPAEPASASYLKYVISEASKIFQEGKK
jgi:hypothetical protein